MMMIDRRTTLLSGALVVVMVLAAAVRMLFIHGSSLAASQETPLLWQICLLPVIAASLVVGLAANGRRTPALGAKAQTSLSWGRRLSIGCCLSLLLIQALLIVTSLGLPPTLWFGLPPLDWLGWGVVIAMMALVLQALNQMPKLPWLGQRPGLAGDLGPIYGPRYMRANARIWFVCLVTLLPCICAAPRLAWVFVLIAMPTALVWTKTLQIRYGRRWQVEQSASSDTRP
ncbi:hypothetical protein [Bradyrhizobium sp. STM 3809]|uniref:hypothetical protein n=1 Tax=Bradyrhizobium sp. STM 3809 TaxID=551936 RepID=UPI0002406087|nr:hypothetical protein [Bradyrhizobium sp. STM 3809]CCD99698.1 membrane hypothetical protein [Bradyrhizobium sp. STM 3809]